MRRIDFLGDVVGAHSTAGFAVFGGDISDRNTASGWTIYSATPTIVNNTVNAVAAIRDPMGARDSFGRFKHRVAVGTASDFSLSDAGITAFYDRSNAQIYRSTVLLPGGSCISAYNHAVAGRDYLEWKCSVQSVSADAWGIDENWGNTGMDGSEDLPWTDGAVFSMVDAVSGASIVDKSSPVVLFGSDEGLAISHAKSGDNTNGLTTIIDNVAHWPAYRGTQKFSFALESDAELFGQDLTASGAGVTYTSGVFDNCATFDGTDYLSRTGDANLNLGTDDWAILMWVKSTATANPGAVEMVCQLRTTGGGNDIVNFYFNTSGHLVAQMSDDGGATVDAVTFAQDVYDAEWHLVLWQRNGLTLELDIDGEQVGTVAVSNAAGSVDPDELYLGAIQAGTNQFNGSIDHAVLHIGACLSADEIRREYHKGLRAMQSDVSQQHFDNADVDYVRVSPTGAYRIVGDESKAYIMDDHDIIIATDGPPDSDSIQDPAIWEVPGGYSYVLGASSSIESVQTNPNILEGMR